MKSLLFLICAILFLGILAAGCTTPAPVPTPVTTVPTPVPATPVIIVKTPPLTDPALTGNWNFKGGMVAGGTMPAVPNNVYITLMFNNDGTLSGFGGCNNYNGGYTLTGQTTEFGKTITIGPIANTLKFCADTSDVETTYLNNLQNAKTYSITNNKMIIRTATLNQLSYDKAV